MIKVCATGKNLMTNVMTLAKANTCKLMVGCDVYDGYITNIEHETTFYGTNRTSFDIELYESAPQHVNCRNSIKPSGTMIDKVLFNDPATIVFWADGTKTVVKAQNGEEFDPEKGLAMAITKKALGNEGNYYNVIGKWIEEYNKPKIDVEKLLRSKHFTFEFEEPKLGMWIIKVTILHEDGSVVGHSQYRTMYQSKGAATRRARQVYGDNPLVKWEVVQI